MATKRVTRVGPDGRSEKVSISDLKIGDVILQGGKALRSKFARVPLAQLDDGRRFRHPEGGWCLAVEWGEAIFGRELVDPTNPFSEPKRGKPLRLPVPFAEVPIVDFEEVERSAA